MGNSAYSARTLGYGGMHCACAAQHTYSPPPSRPRAKHLHFPLPRRGNGDKIMERFRRVTYISCARIMDCHSDTSPDTPVFCRLMFVADAIECHVVTSPNIPRTSCKFLHMRKRSVSGHDVTDGASEGRGERAPRGGRGEGGGRGGQGERGGGRAGRRGHRCPTPACRRKVGRACHLRMRPPL